VGDDFLYQQNEFFLGAVFLASLLVAGEVGFELGRRRHEREFASRAKHLAEVQTALFAVLGLLLAFSLALSLSRYDNRKQALVEETNAIGRAYLRTGLLPTSEQETARATLMHYTDLRLQSAKPGWNTDTGLLRGIAKTQRQLWNQATSIAAVDPRSLNLSLYVDSLNAMFDAQGSRDAARLNHLPLTAPLLIMIISLVSIGILGYRSGLEGGRSLIAAVTLAFVLATVLVIIIDLDHPYRGLITISQQILQQLRQTMGSGP